MSIVSQNMLIDTVDNDDVNIGRIRRSDVFTARANFRVVHLFLFNRRNELLVQQLAHDRNRHPGLWGSSVAGYLFAGESYMQAAIRRLSEELGVRNCDLHLFGKTTMTDEECKKFVSLFIATSEGPFQYDHQHIANLEFLSIERIVELNGTGQREFTPTFLHVLNFYQQRFYQQRT